MRGHPAAHTKNLTNQKGDIHMNDFNRLLTPDHKGDCTFVLSNAFLDEAGQPLEWALRPMTRAEQSRWARAGQDETALLELLAATLIRPRFDDGVLLSALSDRCGRPVTAAEALGLLLSWDELRALKSAFLQLNGLEMPFWRRVGQFVELLDGQSDARARLMHLALQNHHLTPRDYFALTEPEQAFIAASDIVLQRERERAQKKASITKRR